MIQFNLLPDVKLEYIKARRTKRMVMLISAVISGASLALLILLFLAVNVFQKTHLNNLTEDIATDSKQLQETPELNKILTVQNQLNNLTALHDAKPVVSRISKYLTQVTPTKVSIADLKVDFTANSISITGGADSLSTVNKFIDTLKFTTYETKDGRTNKAFSDVVLTSFGREEGSARYQISLKYDTVIFDANAVVTLVVPQNFITTRSLTEKPSEQLFQPLEETSEEPQP